MPVLPYLLAKKKLSLNRQIFNKIIKMNKKNVADTLSFPSKEQLFFYKLHGKSWYLV